MNLDFDQVDRLHHSGSGSEMASVEGTASRGDDLTTTTMNGVGVERHVIDIKSNPAHVLIAQSALNIVK